MTPKHLIIFIGLIFLINCASQTTIMSKKADNQILINGHPEEWQDDLQYFEDINLSFSVRHNADNIYLVLVTNNQGMIRQIHSRGLFIWFNNARNRDKQVGIKFPVGLSSEFLMTNHNKQGPTSSEMIVATEFEFHEKGKEKIIMPLFNNQLNIKIEPIRSKDIFAVEMAIPHEVIYGKKQPAPPSKLGIGIELVEIDQSKMKHNFRNSSGGTGSRNGTGSTMKQGRGSKRPNSSRQSSTPLNFEKWLKIELGE